MSQSQEWWIVHQAESGPLDDANEIFKGLDVYVFSDQVSPPSLGFLAGYGYVLTAATLVLSKMSLETLKTNESIVMDKLRILTFFKKKQLMKSKPLREREGNTLKLENSLINYSICRGTNIKNVLNQCFLRVTHISSK